MLLFSRLRNLSLLLFLFPLMAQAEFSVSSMFQIEASEESSIKIKNSGEGNDFIKFDIEEIKVDPSGELSYVPYTQENISEWKALIKPSRMILEPGFEKEVTIELLCVEAGTCEEKEDYAFRIKAVPVSYWGDNEKYKGSDEVKSPSGSVDILIGYNVVTVFSKEQYPINADVDYKDNVLTIHNKGDSVIRVNSNRCDKNEADQEGCSSSFYVLKGRKFSKEIMADEGVNAIKLDLSTAYSKYTESKELKVR